MHRKKAITLYETRMSRKYIVMTSVFYLIAAIIWYILGVLLPFMGNISVNPELAETLTREALSATPDETARPDAEKERALLMPTGDLQDMGKTAFDRHLRLIEDAQRTIDFAVYFNYNDVGVEYFYGAILRAADRGVKVRLAFDGKMGGLTDQYTELRKILQNHNNIEVWWFNGVNIWRPAGLMVLLHDKVTIVDGDKMIVGGVNLGMGAYTANYDMEVMITNSGPDGSVGQAQRYFDALVNSELTERKISKNADISLKKKYEDEFSAYFEKSEMKDHVDYSRQGVPVDKVTYLSNPINDYKKEPVILQAMFNLIGSSQNTTVVTPYTLLMDDKIARLREISAKNARFRLITNSLGNSRNAAYSVYYFARDKYISPDIELWEYQAENQIHAKISTYDGRYSMIGSFNLDERSIHIDTESIVIIDSPEFTAQLDRYIEEVILGNSLRVGSDNEYIPSDTVTPAAVESGKLEKYRLYNLLSAVMYVL